MKKSKLAGYRVMLRKTQKDFAEILGISQQSYNKKENGKIFFNPKEMEIIKNIIKERIPTITMEDIFF